VVARSVVGSQVDELQFRIVNLQASEHVGQDADHSHSVLLALIEDVAKRSMFKCL
jgi:hypothetical protein